MMDLKYRILDHGQGLDKPAYETSQAAGLDLRAALPEQQPIHLHPYDRALVPTGIAIALPPGYEAQIRPRSGLAIKSGITLLNSPGTIDADYRGEIKAILVNISDQIFTIERGMRIAQMVIAPIIQARLTEVSTLDDTERGAGGFGSTGV